MIGVHFDGRIRGRDANRGPLRREPVVAAELRVESLQPGLEYDDFRVRLILAVQSQHVVDDRIHAFALLADHVHHAPIRAIHSG